MIGYLNLAQAWVRRSFALLRVHVHDTAELFRLYLAVYFIGGLILPGIFGEVSRISDRWHWMSTLAATTAWLAVIICAILSYVIGARTILGVTAYKFIRRISRMFGVGPSETVNNTAGETVTITPPRLLNVWYWQAFVAMWATAPLVVIALLRPWEGGLFLELLAATFMILHVVATQREIGKLWRRVYATGATIVAMVVIYAVINPGDWERWKGTHQRGQRQSFYEEAYQHTLADKLLALRHTADIQIAQLEYDINLAIAAGSPTATLEAQKARLQLVRARIDGKIESQSMWVHFRMTEVFGNLSQAADSIDIDEETMFGIALSLLVLAVLIHFRTRSNQPKPASH